MTGASGKMCRLESVVESYQQLLSDWCQIKAHACQLAVQSQAQSTFRSTLLEKHKHLKPKSTSSGFYRAALPEVCVTEVMCEWCDVWPDLQSSDYQISVLSGFCWSSGLPGADAHVPKLSFSAALTVPMERAGTIIFDKIFVNEGDFYDPRTGTAHLRAYCVPADYSLITWLAGWLLVSRSPVQVHF